VAYPKILTLITSEVWKVERSRSAVNTITDPFNKFQRAFVNFLNLEAIMMTQIDVISDYHL
jgi:hypothetical protein